MAETPVACLVVNRDRLEEVLRAAADTSAPCTCVEMWEGCELYDKHNNCIRHQLLMLADLVLLLSPERLPDVGIFERYCQDGVDEPALAAILAVIKSQTFDISTGRQL
jgi:hypothetical protein